MNQWVKVRTDKYPTKDRLLADADISVLLAEKVAEIVDEALSVQLPKSFVTMTPEQKIDELERYRIYLVKEDGCTYLRYGTHSNLAAFTNRIEEYYEGWYYWFSYKKLYTKPEPDGLFEERFDVHDLRYKNTIDGNDAQ